MSSAKPRQAAEEGWVKPDWLGSVPHTNFRNYAPNAIDAWFNIPWEARRGDSLYDVHHDALKGSPHALELMRQFYTNLVTLRLKG